MILVIDNYDSFTYNLVQYLGELGRELPVAQDLRVYRNDQISLDDIKTLAPDGVVISPGPGTPDDSGVSLAVIQTLGPTVPILGVCLGHQSIGQVFGGSIIRATRYHSLVIEPSTCPDSLEITAWVEDGTIMGVQHRHYPTLQGVQFHPESILTDCGKRILRNFLLSIAVPAVA
jgi:anthranilate synthase component 2